MQKNSHLTTAVKLLSSIFYLGYSPVFPGTLASLAAFILYIFYLRFNPAAYLIFTLLIIVFGSWLSGAAEKIFAKKDARQIVIDDFCGMLVSLLFLPYSVWIAIAGFIIFRFMDTRKPYPISKIEKFPGGLGIICDDLIAGIYTNFVLQILSKAFHPC
jgi:phosphatidylglycerophosphatase A